MNPVRSVERPHTASPSPLAPTGRSADRETGDGGDGAIGLQPSRAGSTGESEIFTGSSTDPTGRAGGGRILRRVLSLLIGLMIGVLLHYFLYRISLPVEPFIYLVF